MGELRELPMLLGAAPDVGGAEVGETMPHALTAGAVKWCLRLERSLRGR